MATLLNTLAIVLTFCTICIVITECKKKCPNKNSNMELNDDFVDYLSTKRPYQGGKKIKKKEIAPPSPPLSGCEPVKFWYFGRHGTRNPGKKDTEKMNGMLYDLQEKIVNAAEQCKGTLGKKDLNKIKKWKLNKDVTMEQESNLVKQGEKELKGIGKRYARRFPKLFKAAKKNAEYYFESTDSQRTMESASAFIKGALGLKIKKIAKSKFPDPVSPNPLLKFYDSCQKWISEVDDNPDIAEQVEAFENSAAMNETLEKIKLRVGVDDMSVEELTIMYTTCAFETAWKNGKASPWCKLFDSQDFRVMEYREDLDYYWKDGYKFDLNYEQACSPLENLVNYFSNSNETDKVRAYFTHSGAMLKTLARLGLFNDTEPLDIDNFDNVKDDYLWRTSLIDSMASNMAFVLYGCPNGTDQVSFYFQEEPLDLPACDNASQCPLDVLLSNLSPITSNCDLNGICQIT